MIRHMPMPQTAARLRHRVTPEAPLRLRAMSGLRYDAPMMRRRPRFLSIGLGLILILLAGILGPIPGPGGIVLFAAGLALLLKNSLICKKLYVRGKRRWPKYGALCDGALRRKSHRRRVALRQQSRS